MSGRLGCLCILPVLSLAFSAHAADELSRAEIAKLGKAATAYVENKTKKSSGTAFCIHLSGLFLTNQHVIADGSTINLVIDAGQKTQKVLAAKVIRSDKELDLALLRVDGEHKLSAVALGSDESLSELSEIVAFGFPFGSNLATDKTEFPAISVNVGSVTSLRRKDGELKAIQLDAAVNPGNSGGPVLDRSGKVVGIVQGGVRGSGVNFAIPVSHALRFVSRPDVQFTPPSLALADLHKPAKFEVKAVSVLPSEKPLEVELILGRSQGQERLYKMTLVDGLYKVTAVPLPAPDGPALLRVHVNYSAGSVTGSVADQTFKVGDKAVKLADVRKLQMQPKTLVTLADGKTIEGPVAGLDSLAVRLGAETLSLNLKRVTDASFESTAALASVSYVIVVNQGGKEIERLNGNLGVLSANRTELPGTGSTGVREAKLTGGVQQLPGTVTGVAVGGGGRYLVLHLSELRKLAVFDVNEMRIVNYIPLAEDSAMFAAGMDKVVVYLPGVDLLQRWDLGTFQKEASTSVQLKGKIRGLCLGSASRGPLLIHGADGPVPLNGLCFFDPESLKPLEVTGELRFMPGDETTYRASADGRVFVGTQSGRQRFSLIVERMHLEAYPGPEMRQGHNVPSADGQVIFGSTSRSPNSSLLFTDRFKPLDGPQPTENRFLYPAHHGPYFIGIDMKDTVSRGYLFVPRLNNPVLTLESLDIGWGNEAQEWYNMQFPLDRRVHFLPDAKLLILIPRTNNRLALYKVDVDAALEKSSADYLFVTSRPVTLAKKGSTYTYPIVVKAKKGGLKYQLETGPKGMAVSGSGEVTWPVPGDLAEKEVAVVVGIHDAGGQECFHSFTVRVVD